MIVVRFVPFNWVCYQNKWTFLCKTLLFMCDRVEGVTTTHVGVRFWVTGVKKGWETLGYIVQPTMSKHWRRKLFVYIHKDWYHESWLWKGKKIIKPLKRYSAINTKKVMEAPGRRSQTKRDWNNRINRPVRTARAFVQHYNAAIHITMHNTQRQFCYFALASRPTSHLRIGYIKVRGSMYSGHFTHSCQ